MLKINIPGREPLDIKNIVFDYNGTLALDGAISQKIKDLLIEIQPLLNIYILTADTYGTVRKQCGGIGVTIETFPQENAGKCKKEIVKKLGGEKTICVGNGFNDIPMFQESALSIAVIGGEGSSGKLLAVADIVVNSIVDVFQMLLNTDRIKATLRN